MTEDFLHYVWKYQKLKRGPLNTKSGAALVINNVGQHNHLAGPDFFNGKVVIGHQLWAGNIEIHIRSSDWYAHHHEKDPAYDNVILHVVWEHDVEVFRKDQSTIPTLVLKDIVPEHIVNNYKKLFSVKPRFINCEQSFANVTTMTLTNWMERLYFERLERKSIEISTMLQQANNHWEAVLFKMLFKNFGSKINGDSFKSIAQSLPFNVVQKCRQSPQMLEALFMGQAGFFDDDIKDAYQKEQQAEYTFLKQKFQVENTTVIRPQYFRLRPPNFPTIRISQLAHLYHSQRSLFAEVISAKTKTQLYKIFKVSALPYWEEHYNFNVSSKKSSRNLTNSFMDLLIINTVIPLKFCYLKETGKQDVEGLMQLAQTLPIEQNTIIKKINTLKKVAVNSFDSQALLQLKNDYCDNLRCLECAVGNEILRGEA